MTAEDRIKEKMILGNIDRLVHLLINLSAAAGDNREQLYREAVNVIRAIRPSLLSLIGERPEHLEPLLKQLVSQKLPPPSVLRHFGTLQSLLDSVIAASLYEEAEPEENPEPYEETNAVASEAVPADIKETTPNDESTNTLENAGDEKQNPQDLLQALLTSICPEERIYKDYFFRGLHFDYYLSGIKKGVLLWPAEKNLPKIYESLLQKEGISYLVIQPVELSNPHTLYRRLANQTHCSSI